MIFFEILQIGNSFGQFSIAKSWNFYEFEFSKMAWSFLFNTFDGLKLQFWTFCEESEDNFADSIFPMFWKETF